MEKIIRRIFNKDEILSIESFYPFIEKKKIVTFVPVNNVERLTKEMSKAGAGVIGNYEMCSFRTEGTGTFKPNSKANPVSGVKNRLSYEKEIKLEMECETDKLNKVVDSLLRNHPYDEVAYEIYSIRKRDKKPIGSFIELKSKILFRKLIKRLNKKINKDIYGNKSDFKFELKKIAVLASETKHIVFESAKMINCDCIIEVKKSNFKLYKI